MSCYSCESFRAVGPGICLKKLCSDLVLSDGEEEKENVRYTHFIHWPYAAHVIKEAESTEPFINV